MNGARTALNAPGRATAGIRPPGPVFRESGPWAVARRGAREARLVTFSENFDGRLAHLGVVDLAEAVDQLDPLLGLEHRVDLLGGLACSRRRAAASRRGCGRRGRPCASVLSAPSKVISEMIWCGFIVPWRVSRRWIVRSVIEPGPWWPRIGMPLIAAMSTAVPVECSETLPDVGQVAVAALAAR